MLEAFCQTCVEPFKYRMTDMMATRTPGDCVVHCPECRSPSHITVSITASEAAAKSSKKIWE